MTDSATLPQGISIVVPGEAKPYRERTHTFRRRRRGKRGQPIGSIGVGSHMPVPHKSYQTVIGHLAMQAMGGRDPLECPVRLHIRSYVSIPKSTSKALLEGIRLGIYHPCKTPDLTNVIKLAEDALIGVVIKDDKQVVRQAADTGRYFSFCPRLEIVVEPMTYCRLQADELAGDGDT